VDIAFCYPYGLPELEALVRDCGGYWQADTIGVSQRARPLTRLSNSPGQVDGSRPGLYLVARQHSGETPGSWVLDGLLRHLATLGERAPLVWAVPLSNMDGVEQGDYGKDNFPYDVNRAWGSPPMRHETLVIQRDMQRWKARCKPTLGLDFHAPGASEADGAYFYLPDPDKYGEQHRGAAKWADVFGAALTSQVASKQIGRVARYASRWETPSFVTYCCHTLGLCGLTLETPYALAGETLLTPQLYQEAGARMATAIVKELGS
jgi:predicted deacylase